MVKRGILILISFLVLSTAAAQETSSDHPTESACPFIKIEPERLADLNIPRFGNAIFCVNGEMTVTGGHTSGFIPTATAEYYKDGKWHLLQMVYPPRYRLQRSSQIRQGPVGRRLREESGHRPDPCC